MAVQTVTFRVTPAATATPLPHSGVLYLAGVPASDALASATDDLITDGRSAETFVGAGKVAGSSGAVADFINALYAHDGVDLQTYFIRLVGTHTLTQVQAQLDKFKNIPNDPTYLSVAGNLCGLPTTGANVTAWLAATPVQTANAIATRLESLAAGFNSRAIVSTGQTTSTNDKDWGAANGADRLMGVANEVDNKAPAAYWIAAREVQVGERGRGDGMNGARVYVPTGSSGALDHNLTPASDEVGTNDENYVSTVVRDRGVLEVMGGEFKTAQTNDPQRWPDVAFRMDLIKQRAIAYARRNLLSRNYRLARFAAELTNNAQPLVTDQTNAIQEITFRPVERSGDSIVLALQVTMTAAPNMITVNTTLSV